MDWKDAWWWCAVAGVVLGVVLAMGKAFGAWRSLWWEAVGLCFVPMMALVVVVVVAFDRWMRSGGL